MVIVAGHITVDPEQRESYLAGCMSVVEKGRFEGLSGCHRSGRSMVMPPQQR
jgi:hypothetical protein